MNQQSPLETLLADRATRPQRAIPSICTAHPLAIEAALLRGLADDTPVLIEATCNQVNQEGGYTGMTPAAFLSFVRDIAARVGFDPRRIIFGGDHLGPNPWRKLPAGEAMARASQMVQAYVAAGFEKIHLDTSMGCAGESAALDDQITAPRAAELAVVVEKASRSAARKPVYIVGTEVPPPGGAHGHLDAPQPTTADRASLTLATHREAFRKAGVEQAFERVIGLVVQPGVEFGNESVAIYDPQRARDLSEGRKRLGVTYEAHSTDYQPATALRALVDDGFGILKVGPGITFALREALYGLDNIVDAFGRPTGLPSLKETMEQVMQSSPDSWRPYYPGDETEQRLLRHYSYSDRIRYYWNMSPAKAGVAALLSFFGQRSIPATLISQYLGRLHEPVVEGRLAPTANALILAAMDEVLKPYAEACR